MRHMVLVRLTHAGQMPSFSGSSRPQFAQRVRSGLRLMENGSPFASCSMPRAASLNCAATDCEYETMGKYRFDPMSSNTVSNADHAYYLFLPALTLAITMCPTIIRSQSMR